VHPAIDAAGRGDLGFLIELINAGGDVNERCPDTDLCPFTKACAHGHLDCVKFLYEKGCDVYVNDNRFGFNALMMAIVMGHNDIVRWLVSKNYDFDYKNFDDEDCHEVARIAGNREAVRILRYK
jgi:ankyrin repeat protein